MQFHACWNLESWCGKRIPYPSSLLQGCQTQQRIQLTLSSGWFNTWWKTYRRPKCGQSKWHPWSTRRNCVIWLNFGISQHQSHQSFVVSCCLLWGSSLAQAAQSLEINYFELKAVVDDIAQAEDWKITGTPSIYVFFSQWQVYSISSSGKFILL